MPATLIWGKAFELRPSRFGEEIHAIEGGHEMLSWTSVADAVKLSEQYGVRASTWPVYPDCEVEAEAPLDDAVARSSELRREFAQIPNETVEGDHWLKFVSGLLRDGYSFLVMV